MEEESTTPVSDAQPEPEPVPATEPAPEPAPVAPAEEESRYTLAECREAALSGFGVSPETVVGAFALAGLTTPTRAELASAIDRFLAQEV